ncbi:MAG: aminotransferase class V-fold PLP-dependent enzyme [Nitrospinota bacterium]|nr:MAG: aminotransferase class V-fold PLP-dependent enzyme [Nitrospinota bacterium]
MGSDLKSQFLLDPDVIFLNHGSYGACPRPVFEAYQRWQRELERQPVEFLSRRRTELLAEARTRLATYLGVDADEVVYFPNPTTAINMVVRSLHLQPGDEILATDHEYGAMDRTWRFICRKTGARYVQQPIPLPVTTTADFVETFWAGVTERTRVIFISHITSPTALTFPVKEICQRARRAGILSIVDGAHAPGQVPLNLRTLGADIYTGACHKWLCAPKGSAFLYARREVQDWLEPLVVSWGWESDTPSGSRFIDYHEWQGTRDLAAFLSVPAAIEFQAAHDWEAVRQHCRALASQTRQRLSELTGLDPICPDAPEWFTQMIAARLPPVDIDQLKARLYDEFRIEVPPRIWNGQHLIRVSFQAYNGQEDVDALVEALQKLLPL